MKIHERVQFALTMWDEIIRTHRSMEPTQFSNVVFPQFIESLVRTSRLDEAQHQKALKRIDNLKRWISSSEFNGTSKHYAMSITLLGYDSLAEMKKEITEYAPDLLEEFALYTNTEGLGGSFLLKDYESNQNDSTQYPPLVDETKRSGDATTLAETEKKS